MSRFNDKQDTSVQKIKSDKNGILLILFLKIEVLLHIPSNREKTKVSVHVFFS